MGDKIITGYKYSGSFALAIGMGPVDILHEIKNGDTVIWTGPVFRTSADGTGKTTITTKLGRIHFYWGTSGQSADPILGVLTIDTGSGVQAVKMPGYKNLCYAVCEKLQFGRQVSPPNLLFNVSRFPALLSYDPGVSRMMVTAGGDNFTSVPTVTINGDGTGATAVAVIKAKKLWAIKMTNPGKNFTWATVAITGGGGSGATAIVKFFHEINGDALIPEIEYDLLTNSLYGVGAATTEIDKASFDAAAQTQVDEGFGISAVFDQETQLRELAGKLFSYCDMFPHFDTGKIFFKQIRREAEQDTPASIPELTIADILEEPTPKNENMEATWNNTRVTFVDRDNKFEESTEPYDDPANFAIVQESRPRSFNYPYISRRAAAKLLAQRIGIRGGLPPVYWTLKLKPVHRSIKPGDLRRITYAPLGVSQVILRVMEVRRGTPEKPLVEIDCMEELTWAASTIYTPPSDGSTIEATQDGNGNSGFQSGETVVRLSWVPPELKGVYPDGFVAAMNQPDAYTTKAQIFWTYNPTVAPYKQLALTDTFPVSGELISFQHHTDFSWRLRVKVPNIWDFDTLTAFKEDVSNLFIMLGHRRVKTVGTAKNEHWMMSLWVQIPEGGLFEAFNSDTYDIEVVGAAFGTSDIRLETVALDGILPCSHCYIGRTTDFFILTSKTINFERPGRNSTIASRDPDYTRYIKAPVSSHALVQAVADVPGFRYDRDDYTMGPDGTLVTNWGDRALTSYELYDVAGMARILGTAHYQDVYAADIDEALYAVFHGFATQAQSELVDHIDRALGFMTTMGSTIYNELN